MTKFTAAARKYLAFAYMAGDGRVLCDVPNARVRDKLVRDGIELAFGCTVVLTGADILQAVQAFESHPNRDTFTRTAYTKVMVGNNLDYFLSSADSAACWAMVRAGKLDAELIPVPGRGNCYAYLPPIGE